MRLVVAVNDRFVRTADGAVWTNTSATHADWLCHLRQFDRLRIVARVQHASSIPSEGWQRADGEGLEFFDLPYFVGPMQYLRHYKECATLLRRCFGPEDAIIVRLPAWHITGLLAAHLARNRHPYAVEVHNDSTNAADRQSSSSALRQMESKLLARRTDRASNAACQAAHSAAYVTQNALQQRFPPGPQARSFAVANIRLSKEDISSSSRSFSPNGEPKRIVFVGSLDTFRKGSDVLLQAFRDASGTLGVVAELEIVGGGEKLDRLRALAENLGISEHVLFTGHLTAGEEIRRRLDQADLFVLPSRCEGLPRAVIEAMARGLPCLATSVGGLGELLRPEFLVAPGDSDSLASKITEVLSDPERMERMSQDNLKTAGRYTEELVTAASDRFLEHVRRQTIAAHQG